MGMSHSVDLTLLHLSKTKIFNDLAMRKRKEVISAVESGSKKPEVTKTFPIPPCTVSTTLKNNEKIVEVVAMVARKQTTKDEFPKLEECLVMWLRQCRSLYILFGGQSICKGTQRSHCSQLCGQ